jgi:hypothetical protein
MKTPSSDLFDLIKSLSSAEKRYFKLYAQLFHKDGTADYVTLFDAIDKQPEYDEAKLLSKLKSPALIKNIAYNKNYLYTILLASLRSYEEKGWEEIQIRNHISDIHLLNKRGLNVQAKKLIKKVKAYAAEKDNAFFMLEMLDQQRVQYSTEMLSDPQPDSLKDVINQTIGLSEDLAQRNFFNAWYGLLGIYNSQLPNIAATQLAAHDFITHRYVTHYEPASRVATHLAYYRAVGTYYYVIHDARCFQYFKQGLGICKSHYTIASNHSHLMIFYSGLMTAAVSHQEYDVLLCVLEGFALEQWTNPYYTDTAAQMTAKFTLEAYRVTGQFELSCARIPDIIALLDQNTRKIFIQDLSLLYGYSEIAIALFATSRYDESLIWLNRCLNHPSVKNERRSFFEARLLRCMLFFCQGEYLVVQNETIAALRMMREENMEQEQSKAFLKMMQRAAKAVLKGDVHEILRAYVLAYPIGQSDDLLDFSLCIAGFLQGKNYQQIWNETYTQYTPKKTWANLAEYIASE